jgi:DNA-binding NtrC family response regulator
MTPRVLLVEAAGTGDDGLVPGLPRTLAAPLAPRPTECAGLPDPDPARIWTAHAPVTREFLLRLREAAEQETPVYLHGEPGSGRRCAARMLCRWREEWRAGAGQGRRDGERPVPILRVPSLRERPEDLTGIAEHHLATLARDSGQPARRLTSRALDALQTRGWQGNVTELHAVLATTVQRLGDRPLIDVTDLPQSAEPTLHPSQQAKDVAQRDCLLRQLHVARSVSAAAKLEGCTRANYIRLMRRLGILRADCVAP